MSISIKMSSDRIYLKPCEVWQKSNVGKYFKNRHISDNDIYLVCETDIHNPQEIAVVDFNTNGTIQVLTKNCGWLINYSEDKCFYQVVGFSLDIRG